MKRENEMYWYNDGIQSFAIKVTDVHSPIDLDADAPITAISYSSSIIRLDTSCQKQNVKSIVLTDSLLKQIGFTCNGSIYTLKKMVEGEPKFVQVIAVKDQYKLDISDNLGIHYTMPFCNLDMLQSLVFQFLHFELPINLQDVNNYIQHLCLI